MAEEQKQEIESKTRPIRKAILIIDNYRSFSSITGTLTHQGEEVENVQVDWDNLRKKYILSGLKGLSYEVLITAEPSDGSPLVIAQEEIDLTETKSVSLQVELDINEEEAEG